MKGAVALRKPVGTPFAHDNSSVAISYLEWISLGTLTAPASAAQVYNSSTKAIELSDGAIAVHTITFTLVPNSGNISFTFAGYGDTGNLAFGGDATAFQALLDTLFGAGKTVVTGDFAGGFVIYYPGFSGPMSLPTKKASNLKQTGVAVVETIASTITGVVQNFFYSVPPAAAGELIPMPLKNGSKLFAKAYGAADATTGFLVVNFLA